MVLGWDILDKQLLLLHRAWGEILGCGLSTCGSVWYVFGSSLGGLACGMCRCRLFKFFARLGGSGAGLGV